MKKLILTLMAILCVSAHLSAQGINAVEDMARKRAAERVAQMNDYVSFMASKNNPLNTRRYYRTKALNLYIGKGGEYYLNDVRSNGVVMEVSSVNRRTVSKLLIRDYFTNLINMRYTSVDITSTEAAEMKISNLQKIDDDTYVCTCQFVMLFTGKRGDGLTYRDKTTKRIKCYVKAEEVVEDDGSTSVEYMVLLGDTQCVSTERI